MDITYRCNGKIMILGEYIVLDGSYCIAIPTLYGQSLNIKYLNKNTFERKIYWNAIDMKGNIWFKCTLCLNEMNVEYTSNNLFSDILLKIFLVSNSIKTIHNSYVCTTYLNYPLEWGLGSSAMLINLIAKWLNIDPFILNTNIFHTSGYDIACVKYNCPILYKKDPFCIKKINIKWKFLDDIYFLFLNKSQNSLESVNKIYKSIDINLVDVKYMSDLVLKLLKVDNILDFCNILDRFEDILSDRLNIKKIKDRLFPDYKGCIKSLGAWGGDFVLVTKVDGFIDYFNCKGYKILIPCKNFLML